MKFLSRGSVFFLVAAIASGVFAADTLQNEILGVRWTTDIATLKHFEKLWQKDEVAFYINPGVKHTIYEIQVPGVIYGFYENKFFAVYVKIDDPSVYNRLRKELTDQYGDPKITQAVKSDQQIFSWKTGSIKIKLKYYLQDGKMKLAFYYMPLSEVVNETQQEALQEKTWTLFPVDKGMSPDNLRPEDLPSIPLLRF